MTAMTSEYRLVDVVTSEEQLRFRLTDDRRRRLHPGHRDLPRRQVEGAGRRLHRDEPLCEDHGRHRRLRARR